MPDCQPSPPFEPFPCRPTQTTRCTSGQCQQRVHSMVMGSQLGWLLHFWFLFWNYFMSRDAGPPASPLHLIYFLAAIRERRTLIADRVSKGCITLTRDPKLVDCCIFLLSLRRHRSRKDGLMRSRCVDSRDRTRARQACPGSCCCLFVEMGAWREGGSKGRGVSARIFSTDARRKKSWGYCSWPPRTVQKLCLPQTPCSSVMPPGETTWRHNFWRRIMH